MANEIEPGLSRRARTAAQHLLILAVVFALSVVWGLVF